MHFGNIIAGDILDDFTAAFDRASLRVYDRHTNDPVTDGGIRRCREDTANSSAIRIFDRNRQELSVRSEDILHRSESRSRLDRNGQIAGFHRKDTV